MSVRVIAWAWEHGPEDRGEMLVLLALADHADDAGRCFPSMASVAQKARMTERGAQKIIRRLEAAGIVQTVTGGGRGGCNVYQIALQNPEHETGNAVANPEPETGNASAETQKPRTPVHKTPNGGSPEPSGTVRKEEEPLFFSPADEKPKRRRPEVPLPEGWVPSDRNIADATARQFTAEEIRHEADRFRDYHHAKDTRFRDWDAAWRTWLGNARRFDRGVAGGAPPGRGRPGSSLASIVARRHAQGLH